MPRGLLHQHPNITWSLGIKDKCLEDVYRGPTCFELIKTELGRPRFVFLSKYRTDVALVSKRVKLQRRNQTHYMCTIEETSTQVVFEQRFLTAFPILHYVQYNE